MRRTASARARQVVAALAVTLSLVAAAAAPSAAAPAPTGWSDSGPGAVGGSGGSSSQTGGRGEFHCGQRIGLTPGALYMRFQGRWSRWWDYGYQSCVGQGASSLWDNSGVVELVPTGFLVYRFYGSASNPVQAMTRSRVNLTAWGAAESSYSFPATNPFDAGVAAGAPWRAGEDRNWQQYYDGGAESAVFRNDAGQLTTSYPTRVAGSCVNAQSDNSIATWFTTQASDTEKIALRAALGYDYWVASAAGRYPATGRAEAGIAQIRSGYRFDWNAWVNGDTSAPPAPKADGDAYYLEDFTFETRPCASPFQFASTTATPPAERTVIGTCYVPLMRKRIQLRNNRTGALGWKWPSVQHDWTVAGRGDGERMSNYYRGTAYTPTGPGGDTLDRGTTGLTAAQQTQLITGWRNAMVADYRAWWSRGITTGAGAQVVPVNPYPAGLAWWRLMSQAPVDVNAAADALYHGARCRVGSAIQFDVPQATDVPEVGASLDVRVDDVEVFQVSPRDAQITLTAGPLRCDGAGCPPEVSLRSLTWTSKLTAVGGYKLCPAPNPGSSGRLPIPHGCDGVVTSSKVVRNGIAVTEQYTVRFVRPTDASQVLRLTVEQVSGTYAQAVQTSGLQIRGISPITGQQYTIDTGPLNAQVVKPLPVSVTGTPVPLTPTATGYALDMPVVGAVQVPVR
jgi:hypothetical protein